MKIRPVWILAIVPTVAMVLIAMYPQISLWRARGEHWAGSYSAANYDEVAYSAYINGLMNGKPRKYDPMMGTEHAHESIFSLQFIPAYAIAVPARLFGVTASTAFIVLQFLVAVFSVLALFLFFRIVTSDDLVAAAGVLVVLCLGTAITYEGSLRDMVDGGLVIEYLPFLRRYQPGVAFPIFFLLCAAVWKAFVTKGRESLYAVAAGCLFAVLVFSYFYLWTTAVVWLGFVFLIGYFAIRERRSVLVTGAKIAGLAAVALVPYLILLNMRSRNSDEVQLLSLTHARDLTAPTILVGFLFTAVCILLGYLGRIDLRSPAAVFALAFLLTPLGVLNQQVITGRSLQPVHYEIFIANYCVLAGVVLVLWLALAWRRENDHAVSGAKRWIVAAVAVLAAGWGFQEAWHASTRNAGMAAVRDAVYPAAEFIREASEGRDGTVTIHTPNPIAGSFIPTVVPSRILWNPHLVAGGSLGEKDNKLQFYRFLYYSGFGASDLDNSLKMKWFEMTAAIFGGGRALPQLGGVNHPITDEEIAEEVEKYRVFTESIDAAAAYAPSIDYIIVSTGDQPNFDNVDRWYSRDASYVMGDFTVWALTPRGGSE